jgi:hypothetical protein
MTRSIIDTNVPIVANGRDDGERQVRLSCREASIEFLLTVMERGFVLLDASGEIQDEYRRYLNPSGQPGTGDRFYQLIIQRYDRTERIEISKRADGEFTDLADEIINSGFHRKDRMFAALSCKEGVPVTNAIDSDWANDKDLLVRNGVTIQFLCGCDPAMWRE